MLTLIGFYFLTDYQNARIADWDSLPFLHGADDDETETN